MRSDINHMASHSTIGKLEVFDILALFCYHVSLFKSRLEICLYYDPDYPPNIDLKRNFKQINKK